MTTINNITSYRECDEDLMVESRDDHTPGIDCDHTTGIIHLSANASSDFLRVLREIQQTSG